MNPLDTAPWKRSHNLVLWLHRETSTHMWCLGCGMKSTWHHHKVHVTTLPGPVLLPRH